MREKENTRKLRSLIQFCLVIVEQVSLRMEYDDLDRAISRDNKY